MKPPPPQQKNEGAEPLRKRQRTTYSSLPEIPNPLTLSGDIHIMRKLVLPHPRDYFPEEHGRVLQIFELLPHLQQLDVRDLRSKSTSQRRLGIELF